MSELVTDVKVAANGRMVLPKVVRNALGMDGETRLVVKLEDGEVRLVPIAAVVDEVQRLYRENVVNDISSGEFLAQRKAEEEGADRRGR